MNKYYNYDIEKLVSHRGHMLLLDRVIEADRLYAIAEITINKNSTFYQAGQGVPAWAGIEYMAQAVAVLGGVQALEDSDPVPMGYLLGTRKYYCDMPWFEAGCVLQVRCEEEVLDGNGLGAYGCQMAVTPFEEKDVVAQSRLTVYKMPTIEQSKE
ncbi:MAG: 3-hydroxylacyl-ACP dehydratase [Gammaproteobacteria bacterium]|nr:3-hydroxylacyl-ACP dehydratase [Gammaproteobacteria bacterium]